MLLDRQTGAIEHHVFREILDLIDPGDVLVLNTTRVIPARLHATKADTGGGVEVLLLRQLDETRWQALVGGRRVLEGTKLVFGDSGITAEVVEVLHESERVVRFSQPINDWLDKLGEMPLPPYIHTPLSRPGTLPDGLQPAGRLGRRADREPALHAGTARTPCAPKA